MNEVDENFKERLKVEQKELKEKFIKLVTFINSDKFYELSPNNKLVLKNQKIAMELYLDILNIRVYEDVDSAFIPDYGALQVMGQAFGGKMFNTQSFDKTKLEQNDK